MDKRAILKNYKQGNKNYEILRLIIRKRRMVNYKDLMFASEPNPVILRLLNNPEIYKREKVKLKHNVNKLNKKLREHGWKIRCNCKKHGYYLKQFDKK